MDLPSYYRHQARGARRLAVACQDQLQAKTALERLAKEYDWIAQDLQKICGRDPVSGYDLAAHIDGLRTRRAVLPSLLHR